MPLAGQPAPAPRPDRRPAGRRPACRTRRWRQAAIAWRNPRAPAAFPGQGGETRRRSQRQGRRSAGVYEPAESYGYRALADRLWPRGVRRGDARLDERAREVAPSDAQRGRQHPGRRSQDSAVSPLQVRACDLTSQRSHLMAGHHDLRVLGLLATCQQLEPAKGPDHDQIGDEETQTAILPQPAQSGQTGEGSAPATSSEAVQGDGGHWSGAPVP
jgi:uncharacterized protein YeaO (DUF488 family)